MVIGWSAQVKYREVEDSVWRTGERWRARVKVQIPEALRARTHAMRSRLRLNEDLVWRTSTIKWDAFWRSLR